ncbi:AEC family transporter [Ralstonia pseudosolanacearum]|uniref:AEC family transporter n=1 Tax=Ralstonia pseudosolanacearum TaxID=1310165 RepID=UPI000E573949|nr:transporter [Ralstonia solanacearum]BEU67757.1 AEC family transporter [Ralstonia pseudosolanacearum]AXW71701.1 transporter [Ralstonia solanacearum]QKL57386.1 AEC family transporter [Ralstonia solanacearum]QKM33436.1 AEC family transporter [Ralstonia solanacearum]
MTGAVLLALAPVALLVALGHLIRRTGFVADAFWPQAERLCYYILLPALFMHSLATAHVQSLPVAALACALIGSTAMVALMVVAARPLLKVDGAAFTSVFQGAIRFNNYVGVSLAAGLFGAKGVALAAVCNAAIVPSVNLMCVLVFARYGSVRLRGAAVARQIVTNPLVVACVGGIALQVGGIEIPVIVEPAVRALGSASMPLGLLCVGAALNLGESRSWFGPICVSSAFKFLLMPVSTFMIARMVGLGEVAMTVALLFQALPTASSSYIMARQLGGDAPLMAGITAAQTMLAALAIPVVTAGLMALRPLL